MSTFSEELAALRILRKHRHPFELIITVPYMAVLAIIDILQFRPQDVMVALRPSNFA